MTVSSTARLHAAIEASGGSIVAAAERFQKDVAEELQRRRQPVEPEGIAHTCCLDRLPPPSDEEEGEEGGAERGGHGSRAGGDDAAMGAESDDGTEDTVSGGSDNLGEVDEIQVERITVPGVGDLLLDRRTWQVRSWTILMAWTILQQCGPDRLELWHNALHEHQMALITCELACAAPKR